MKTVAILHDWAGGNHHVRKFSLALKDSGFEVIKDDQKTDIIIAHSAGCYRIKDAARANLFVLIGPPYWPNKSLIKRLFQKTGEDNKLRLREQGVIFTLNKLLWQSIYIAIKPSYTFIALRNSRRLNFLEQLKISEVILIRNGDDYFCSPEIKNIIQGYPKATYKELPGAHDDFMTNPKPYIDLIKNAA